MGDFAGLMVATLTPFDAAGRLDLGVVRSHADFLLTGGASGLCPAGTTGEMLYLSVGEKVRLIEASVRAASGRAPVIAGVWAVDPREVLLLARAAEAAGAAAVFLPPPIYYPADGDTIYHWYAAVHAATKLPVFAYNIPAYAANAIPLDTVERLAADGVIAGIKDSTGKAEQMTALLKIAEPYGGKLAVEAASDSFVLEARQLGARGFISALANVWPGGLARLWAGDDSLQPAVGAVRSAVKRAGGIPALKYLATRRGFAFGESRLPFVLLSGDQLTELDRAFETAAAVLG